MELISRKDAIGRGLKRYFTGEPCKYGHVCERLVASYSCLDCKQHREFISRYKTTRAVRPKTTKCECCDQPRNGKGQLHLDHDHGRDVFRGWLCMRCNVGIGMLGDSAEGVRRALCYLERFENTLH
jgi:hypothetical protein